MDINAWTALLAATIVAGTPILFAAAGELLAERSGILNLGVEGMMLVGAALGFIVTVNTGNHCLVLPVIVQILHFPAVHMGFAYFLTTSKGSFYRGPSLEIFQFGSDKSGSFSGLNMLKINHLVCCSVQFHRYPGFKIID
jgi:hypothetical protein